MSFLNVDFMFEYKAKFNGLSVINESNFDENEQAKRFNKQLIEFVSRSSNISNPANIEAKETFCNTKLLIRLVRPTVCLLLN